MAHRRGGFQKKIDTVHWTYGSIDNVARSAGTTGQTVLPAQHLPETLMRIRGEWIAYADGVQAPGGQVAIGVGLALVPEGTGTTVLWSPITDGDAPWIWVDYAMIGYEEAVTDVIDMPVISAVRRVIDSKAMRKVRNTELQFVVENATSLTAMTVNVAGNVRVLAGS